MSQLIQSYREELKDCDDPLEKIDLLNNVALELRDSDSQQVIEIATKTLKESEERNYNKGVAFAHLNLGFQNDFNGKKSKALPHLEKSLKLFINLKDNHGLSYTYKYLAFYYWGLGDVDKALEMIYLGYEITKNKNTIHEGWSNYVLGVFFFDLKKTTKARDYYNKALKVFKELDYEHGLGRTLNGLSSIAIREENFDQAVKLSNEALAVHLKSNYNMGLARTYSDLGILYQKINQLEKSIFNLKNCLKIRREVNVHQAIITTLIQLSKVYLKQKDYKNTKLYLSEAYNLALGLNAKTKLFQIHKVFIDYYREKEKLKELDHHYNSALKLNAEVLHKDADSKIKSITNKFLAEKKAQEAEIHQLRNVELKDANDQLNKKNNELQKTLDELTQTKLKKKAITITLFLALFLFFLTEGFIDPYIESHTNSYYISIGIKLFIALSLKPIESLIEKLLINRLIHRKALKINM